MDDDYGWFEIQHPEETQDIFMEPIAERSQLSIDPSLESPIGVSVLESEGIYAKNDPTSFILDHRLPTIPSSNYDRSTNTITSCYPYDPLRTVTHLRSAFTLHSKLPPQHIVQAYEKQNAHQPKCEECHRAYDDEGRIKHEGWCSQYGPCPNCGSTNTSTDGFGGMSHCFDCSCDSSFT